MPVFIVLLTQELLGGGLAQSLGKLIAPDLMEVCLEKLVYGHAMVLIVAQYIVDLGQRKLREYFVDQIVGPVAGFDVAHDNSYGFS